MKFSFDFRVQKFGPRIFETFQVPAEVVSESLHCPPENFMNNFRVHQCALEEAHDEATGIAKENTPLGLLHAALFAAHYLGKAAVLLVSYKKYKHNHK